MATQQDVIKAFMKSLDETTQDKAKDAIDEAIKKASDDKFETLTDLAEAFLNDYNANGWRDFLRNDCGIILDNEDTGAITGFDMGGMKIKTDKSIVPEVGSAIRLDNEYRAQQTTNPKQKIFELDDGKVTVDKNGTLSFTKKGLTVHVPDYNKLFAAAESGDKDARKKLIIINGLYTWWIEEVIKLNIDSYGTNYGFTGASSEQEMTVDFYSDTKDRRAAFTDYNPRRKPLLTLETPLMLKINMDILQNIESDSINGIADDNGYLDHTLAHEFTHAIMAVNVKHYGYDYFIISEPGMPKLINEGLAELTRGIDNYRKSSFQKVFLSNSHLNNVLNDPYKSEYFDDPTGQYVIGYALMRYFAKQCADEEFSGINVHTAANQTEPALMLTGQRFTANNGTALVTAGDKLKTDANNNITEITIGKSDNIISTPESKTPVIVKNRKGETIASIVGSASVHEDGYIHKNLSNINVTSQRDKITIKGGNDDDIFSVSGNSNNVSGNNGDDTFSVGGNSSTVIGNEGDDTFSVSGTGNHIDGDNGNDTFSVSGNSNNVIGNDGDDTFSVGGNSNDVIGNDGDDTFSVSGSGNIIDGGSGKDQYIFTAEAKDNTLATFNVADDTIRFAASEISAEKETHEEGYETITICSGQDTLLVINSTDGTKTVNDNIFYDNGQKQTTLEKLLLVPAPVFPDNNMPAAIYGTEGDDSIKNNIGASIVIEGLGGDDSIINGGARGVTLNGGAGDDTIKNYSDDVSLNGGAGDDYVYNLEGNNVSISGGAGDDTIKNYGEDDVHLNIGNDVSIDGGAGDDVIYTFSNRTSIFGDTGNDIIHISKGFNRNTRGNVIINASEGNDTVYNHNYTWDDIKINISNGTYHTQASDSDLIVKFDNGSICLKSALGKKLNIIGTQVGNGMSTIKNEYAYATLIGTAGNDSICNPEMQTNSVLICGEKGNDTIDNGDFKNINGLYISMKASHYVSISGGDGDDFIRSYGSANSIDGGDGNDYIYSGGDYGTVSGGKGDDYFYDQPHRSVLFKYNSGDGNDLIRGFHDSDTLSISGGSYSSLKSDKNVILTVDDGKISLFGAATLSALHIIGTYSPNTTTGGGSTSTTQGGGSSTSTTTGGGSTSTTQGGGSSTSTTTGGGSTSTTQGGGSSSSTVTGGDSSSTTKGGGSSTSTVTGGDSSSTTKGGGSSTSTTTGGDSSSTTRGGSSSTSTTTGGGSSSTTRGSSSSTSTMTGGGSSSTTRGGSSSTSTTSTGTIFDAWSSIMGGGSSSTTRGSSTSSTSTGSIRSVLTTTTSTGSTSTTRGGTSTSTGTSSTSTTSSGSSSTSTTSGSGSTSTTTDKQIIYMGGDKTISNYSEQAVTLGAYTGATFDETGNFFVGSPTGTLIVTNAADKIIDLRDGAGNAFVKAYQASTAGVIDGRGLAGYEIINGSSTGSNVIFAGDGGSELWGGSDDADALVGGNGADIFNGGRFQGADNIFNASSADVVNLTDATLSDIVATVGNNSGIAIGFNTGNVVNIQSTDALSAAVNLADGSSWRYNHVTKGWQSA